MGGRVSCFAYMMPYCNWYQGERYIRLNIAATRSAMKALSTQEFLIWLYCAVLRPNTVCHFSVDEMRHWSGLSETKVRQAVIHFFELGYLTYTTVSSHWYVFHAIPVASQWKGEKPFFNFNLYIGENIAKEIPNASYRAFNLDCLYSAHTVLSPNAFKLWLELMFDFPSRTYRRSSAEDVGINYNVGLNELFKKGFLQKQERDIGPYLFFRYGNVGEKERIEI